MNKLKTTVAVVMLALWMPVIMHCRLESMPFFSFLACCDHPDAAPHQDNDCEEDACSVVETGFYKIEDHAALLSAPLFTFALTPALTQTESYECLVLRVDASGPSPPELSRVWQFFWRTALPPRAPSFVA